MSTQDYDALVKITIENFQSHENTVIEPAYRGHLTVIVGQSRQGKTAIFRALKWLFYNSPDGADFIRWGANFARVTAEYEDGTQVIRYRTTGGVNRYIIRRPIGWGRTDEQIFEGFGRGVVPQEVQQVTGVSPVEIGEGLELNLNLAEQLDGPFLGSKSVSSTTRAKVLGKLAGTEEVDVAGKALGTDMFRWKREAETQEKIVADTLEQLKGYDYLEELKAKIDKLVSIRKNIKAYQEERDNLEKIKGAYFRASYEADEARRKMLWYRDFLNRIAPGVEQLEDLIRLYQSANRAQEEWKKHEYAESHVNRILAQAEDIAEAEVIHKQMQFYKNKLEKLIAIRDEIAGIQIECEAKTKAIDAQQQEITSLNIQYEEMIKMLEVCPLCGADTTNYKGESR